MYGRMYFYVRSTEGNPSRLGPGLANATPGRELQQRSDTGIVYLADRGPCLRLWPPPPRRLQGFLCSMYLLLVPGPQAAAPYTHPGNLILRGYNIPDLDPKRTQGPNLFHPISPPPHAPTPAIAPPDVIRVQFVVRPKQPQPISKIRDGSSLFCLLDMLSGCFLVQPTHC